MSYYRCDQWELIQRAAALDVDTNAGMNDVTVTMCPCQLDQISIEQLHEITIYVVSHLLSLKRQTAAKGF